MNKWMIGLLMTLAFTACSNNKKPDSTKAYFSVVSYIGGQVKQMDSLALTFTKITTIDSISDTSRVTKEEFHKYAKEFLTLPDISSSRNMDDYTEVNDFDEILNNVLLMYTAKNEEAEIRGETIMMQPDESGNTHIKTILVNTMKEEKEASINKNMTWHVGKRFQIVTKVNKSGQPEKISTVIITWE